MLVRRLRSSEPDDTGMVLHVLTSRRCVAHVHRLLRFSLTILIESERDGINKKDLLSWYISKVLDSGLVATEEEVCS